MTGPIEAMESWQQLLICASLFATMVWLQMHPAPRPQPLKLPRERDEFGRDEFGRDEFEWRSR